MMYESIVSHTFEFQISAAGEREWKARDCEIENKPKANYYICERVNQVNHSTLLFEKIAGVLCCNQLNS